MATLIRCSLGVECNGKALHPEKGAKILGVEVAAAGSSVPLVRVVGMKREIRLAAQDVLQIADSKVADGRLAFVAKNGLRVVLTKAQPAQLQFLLQRLRGGTAECGSGIGGGLPGRKLEPSGTHRQPSLATVLQQTAAPCRAVRACHSAPTGGVVRLSLTNFDTEVLKQVMSYCIDKVAAVARLAETCVVLEEFACTYHKHFRINASCSSISPTDVVARLKKRQALEILDLSGWSQLPAGETGAFAQALRECQLRKLSLRGCTKLGDAAVKRILEACPRLEVLNLLDIPRLGNAALAAPLRCLRILAAGSIGRPETAERPGTGSKIPMSLTVAGAQASIGGGPLRKRPPCSVNFTSAILARLAQGVRSTPAGGEESGGVPLTHLVLTNCSEIEVLSRLPRSLVHLDLRGSNLQVPDAAVPGWRPFATLSQLEVLCLAGNTLLSAEALLACITSLPPSALRVLDLSETRADMHMWQHLISSQQLITHLRLAGCTSLGMLVAAQLETLFRGMKQLQVLDISSCNLEDAEALVPRGSAIPAAAPAVQATTNAPSPPVRTPQAFLRTVAPVAWGSAPAAHSSSVENSLAPQLRLLGVGQVGGRQLEGIRRGLSRIAPAAHAVGGSLDIFGSYKTLPPKLQ